MAECRYFPECQRCNEAGDSWLPCAGGADGIRCKGYEPMPDVDALLALADEMERVAPDYLLWEVCEGTERSITDEVADFARRIREALGVTDG